MFREKLYAKNVDEAGKTRLVLVEGKGDDNSDQYSVYTGRSDGNKRVVFLIPNNTRLFSTSEAYKSAITREPSLSLDLFIPEVTAQEKKEYLPVLDKIMEGFQERMKSYENATVIEDPSSLIGRYVLVKILRANGTTIRGLPVALSSISECSKHGYTM